MILLELTLKISLIKGGNIMTTIEEVKAYIEARIEYIVSTRGKYTVAEQELQRVLDQINQ